MNEKLRKYVNNTHFFNGMNKNVSSGVHLGLHLS